MNGVAEGTFAGTPMLCLPLFSDQPDNCQRMQVSPGGTIVQTRGGGRGECKAGAL
jgi:UDP:flavonoid glycosyltransferase YjiC (YdhE family)